MYTLTAVSVLPEHFNSSLSALERAFQTRYRKFSVLYVNIWSNQRTHQFMQVFKIEIFFCVYTCICVYFTFTPHVYNR